MIFFLLFLLIVVAIIAVISSIVARRSSVREPSCGRCGYAVEGLQDFRCPECGCDLRKVGILAPGMVRAMRPVTVATLAAILWTVVLPLPALALTAIIGSLVARTHSNHQTVEMMPSRSAAPAVQIDLQGGGLSSSDYDRAIISVEDVRGLFTIDLVRVELPLLNYRVMGANGRWEDAEGTLDGQVLNQLIAQQTSDDLSGLDPGAEIMSVLESAGHGGGVVAGPVYSGTTVSSSSSVQSEPWFTILSTCFWLGLWLLMLVFIVRRGIRTQRAWNAAGV